MLVLAIDTSTPVVTAGVVGVLRPHEIAQVAAVQGPGAAAEGPAGPQPTRLLAECTRADAFGHAEYLMPLADEALQGAGATLSDIEAIIVGLGPGPFTGLRVGIATAQALGDARSLPVYGVPSHDGVALAGGASASDDDFLVATDARRREVYVSGYRRGRRRVGPLVSAPADVAAQLPEVLRPSWVAGAGAELVAPVLRVPVRQTPGSVSEGLVRAALHHLVTGAVPGPLTPLYLRRPDATVPGAPKPVLPADVLPVAPR